MSTLDEPDTKDIRDEDLPSLLSTFYDALGADPLLSRFFAELDMGEHIPRIASFWSTILFGTKSYSGNAFAPHQKLEGLEGKHFQRWLETLEATVDARFSGPIAEEMKTTAHRIGYTMQMRLGIAPFASYRG